MRSILLAVLIFLIIYLIYQDDLETFISGRSTCNQLDGRCYKTVSKFENPEKASEILAYLNLFSINLLKHLRNKYIWNYHPSVHAREISEFLISNYNPDGIIENAPTSSVNTSYVDDKGKVFAICLREKTSGNNHFQDLHDLEFVVIHELAHMATESFGHEKDYWTHFKFLLKEAKEAGLHNPINYRINPINYCSLEVTYNPYHDEFLKDI